MSEEPTPSAPSSIAWRTTSCIAASCSGVGSTSSDASTLMRAVAAPTCEATFIDTPFFSSSARYSPSVVHSTGYLRSTCCATRSCFICGVSGPIDSPSPITCSVTPWRSSPCPRPSIEQRLGRPGQHVDEAGRDGLAGCVDLAPRLGPAPSARRRRCGRPGSRPRPRSRRCRCRRRPCRRAPGGRIRARVRRKRTAAAGRAAGSRRRIAISFRAT